MEQTPWKMCPPIAPTPVNSQHHFLLALHPRLVLVTTSLTTQINQATCRVLIISAPTPKVAYRGNSTPTSRPSGVHLYFDPERSLSPAIEQQRASSPEDPVVVVEEGSDSEDTISALSDLITVAPDTPPGHAFERTSPLRAPKAQRLRKHADWHDGSMSSHLTAQDSMAAIAARMRALHAHVIDEPERRRRIEEARRREGLDIDLEPEERETAGPFAVLRREYELSIEQFRRENAGMFATAETNDVNAAPGISGRPGSPSRQLGQRRRMPGAVATTRRQHDDSAAAASGDAAFVVVARRVPKLGPCGTMVMNHATGEQVMETKRYRVRADELQLVDEDGDSVMGSDL
ncbi:hypothetical protein F5148DRAFT_368044 [Russula earlei]|uniref:Uncharacterized protein n=1 Tax=Russula earlei TaxID=71964 RepID=A0ACC0U115_9AGAM|nr:hypothetical protein F5148DRAFT_368044 [Russula earlei]